MVKTALNVEAFRVSTGGLVSEPYIERGMGLTSGQGVAFIDPQINHGPNACPPSDRKNLVLAISDEEPPEIEEGVVKDLSLDLFEVTYLLGEGANRTTLIWANAPVEKPLARVALLGILDHQSNSYKGNGAEILDEGDGCMMLRRHAVGRTANEGSGLSMILVPENNFVVVTNRSWVEKSPAISYELTYKPDDPRGIFVTPLFPGGKEPKKERHNPTDPEDEGGRGSDRVPRRPIRPQGQAGAEAEAPEELETIVVHGYDADMPPIRIR